LDRNLPQLQQHNIANQLSQLVSNAKQHRADELLQKQQDKVKSPESFFGATGVATLIRLARVADQDHLPPIYGRLASAARHARLSELQWAIGDVKNRLSYIRLSFTATPALLTVITATRWNMNHLDDLTSGINPFLFGDTTPEHAQAMSNLYQMITAGSAAPSLTDTAQLVTPNKASLPKHLLQSREAIQRTLIIYTVLLGAQYLAVYGLNMFLRTFIDRENQLHCTIPSTPGYALCMPILIIK
jgi:hypothetical protein